MGRNVFASKLFPQLGGSLYQKVIYGIIALSVVTMKGKFTLMEVMEMSNNIETKAAEKMHFFLKSTPPRTTFHQDMTVEERNIMLKHIDYWTDKQNQGIALVFGSVLNPAAPKGIAIIEVENEAQVLKLIEEDPAVIAGIMTTEFYPMKATLPKQQA